MTANQKFNDFSNVGYDEAMQRARDLVPFLREHAAASDRATREFCGDCGTYLLFREDDATASLGVNTATLDEPERVPPTFHIWHESHIAWFETADTFPRHAKGKA